MEKFLENIPSLKQVLLVGGVTLKEDVEKLKKGVNVIVSTPGRLEDIFSNCGLINLSLYVKSLVSESFYNYLISLYNNIKFFNY